MRVCPECRTVNEDDARFCKNCGTKLIRNEQEEEDGERDPRILVFAEAAVLLVLLLVFVWIGNSRNSAKAAAQRYMEAFQDRDWAGVYELTDYPEDGLFQKSRFLEIMEESEQPQIPDYEIYEGEQSGSGDSQIFKVEYTSAEGPQKVQLELELVRQEEKSMLFFDTWKVRPDQFAAQNFSIRVPMGAEAAVDGVSLTDMGLLPEETDGSDVYTFSLFEGTHKLQVAAPWYIVYDTEFTAEGDGQFTVKGMRLSDAGEKAVESAMQKALEAVYGAALAGEDFTAVSGLCLDEYADGCRTSYENLVSTLHDRESVVPGQVTFSDFRCSIRYGSGDTGMIHADMTYDYTLPDTYGNRTEEDASGQDAGKAKQGTSEMKAVFGYDGSGYKLASFYIGSVL